MRGEKQSPNPKAPPSLPKGEEPATSGHRPQGCIKIRYQKRTHQEAFKCGSATPS